MKIIKNMSNQDYHAERDHISCSQTAHIAHSPATYRWKRNNKRVITPQKQKIFDTGTVFHTAILEPEKLDSVLAIGPEVNRNTKKWKEFTEENEGKILFKPSEFSDIGFMAESVRKHPLARELIRGEIEQSVFSTCKAVSGVKIKCRPDNRIRERKMAVDVKSSKDASQAGFERSAFSLRYHVQAAYYLDILRYKTFVFVAVEKTPPFLTAVYMASNDDTIVEKGGYEMLRKGMVKAGRKEYIKNLMLLKKCREENNWPGYSEKAKILYMPK